MIYGTITDDISSDTMDQPEEESDTLVLEDDVLLFEKTFLETVRRLVVTEEEEHPDPFSSEPKRLDANAKDFVPTAGRAVYCQNGRNDSDFHNISETRLMEISTLLYNSEMTQGLDVDRENEGHESLCFKDKIKDDLCFKDKIKDDLWARGLRFHNRHSSDSDLTSNLTFESGHSVDCSSGENDVFSSGRTESRSMLESPATGERFINSRTFQSRKFTEDSSPNMDYCSGSGESDRNSFGRTDSRMFEIPRMDNRYIFNTRIAEVPSTDSEIEELRFWASRMREGADQILTILDRCSSISPSPSSFNSHSPRSPEYGSQLPSPYSTPSFGDHHPQRPYIFSSTPSSSNAPTDNQRIELPTPMKGHIINMVNNQRKLRKFI